ncbi:hypothetical protein NHF50_00685 [Flavobacterium sp. NRK F10]|uniref:hypothetical protein n=1 Tax=Flavobacterium sp. NRK F10 TaxID=2954931 RepID=UPI0020917BA5|nr:hypothetical protein [Flavobacterium sp. NRK F10]MCO6173551.1 hypothetical protein [Flavobacterium sp. NRK F10]
MYTGTQQYIDEMNSFRSLLNGLTTTIESRKGVNYLTLYVIALKKIKKTTTIKD